MELSNATEVRGVFTSIERQLASIQINLIKELAADVLLEINRLTNAGKNAFNVKFIAYSKSYIKQRVKEGLGTSPNAQFTSKMLNSIIIKEQDYKTFTIGPTGSGVRNGKNISNSLVLKLLQSIKNYIILDWTKHYKKLVDKHAKRAAERWSRISW